MKPISILIILFIVTLGFGQSGMTNYGNIHIHSNENLVIHTQNDLNANTSTLHSTERTTPIGRYIFANNSSWINANDSNYIDGYSLYTGSDGFIFPTGDNQVFRPFAKKGITNNIAGAYFYANPSIAITSDPIGSDYPPLPQGGPFEISILSSELLAVSSIEYWDITGDQSTQITLTWNTTSEIIGLTANSLDRLTIVGWRNGRWEEIQSTIDPFIIETSSSTYQYSSNNSTISAGSITSSTIIPDDYAVITLGALRCKKNQVIVQQSLINPSLCRNNDGRITWSGFAPSINYTINFLFNNNSINKTEKSDANGNLQLTDLGAGDYLSVTVNDGICIRNLSDFKITDDLLLDSDMDNLTDCEEVDLGSDPYNPCSPNPLGNLDADCDGDNIRNRDDCQPLATKALSTYDCDEKVLQLDVTYDQESWLNNITTKFKWYDSDPDATPSTARLLSEERDPKFKDLEKGIYNFYVTVEFEGCPTVGKNNIPVEIEDLSSIADDEYTFDFIRDTVYLLNLVRNDQITLDNNRLFIQNLPNDATVTANLDGTVSFVPRSGFAGEITFTYVVCNLSCIDDCNDATVTINILTPDCEFIPNGFSPNGDGINDVLEITCLEKHPGSSLTVFNRWGDEVYGSIDYRNNWDGTWNGKSLPSGTYYYVLKVKARQNSNFYGYIYIQH